MLARERLLPLPLHLAVPDGGHAYVIGVVPLPPGFALPSDGESDLKRSRVRLLESGARLGPGHAPHAELRRLGGGRYSHWNGGIWFSASDNSDPRRNGRAYALAVDEPLEPAIGWLLLILGAAVVASGDRRLVTELAGIAARWRASRRSATGLRDALPAAGPYIAAFAALAGCAFALGPERSPAILVSQPFEASQAANSLLGSAWIADGSVVLRENVHSLRLLDFLSGSPAVPDEHFRFPLHAFLALLLAPLAGATRALLVVNLVAWSAATWTCLRFARAFSGDELAAKWAALLAVAGAGFAAHALDLGPHLLSFAVYMGVVLAIFESGAWERRVGLRTHMALGTLLALGCLAGDAGPILVAGYVTTTWRHNAARHVVPVALAAMAMQPLWAAIAGEVYRHRAGVSAPWILDGAFAELARARTGWRIAFAGSWWEGLVALGRELRSFLGFEAPLVVALGAAGLFSAFRSGGDQRGKAWFALHFIAFSLAAALFVSPASTARGPLLYGNAIFFFAGAGAVLASLVRRREAVFAPLAAMVVVASIAWSTAHFGNVLGPAKAYFHGYERAKALFSPAPVAVQSLTNTDPVPRLFGGTATLAQAGLAGGAPASASEERRVGLTWLAAALLSAVLGAWAVLRQGTSGRLGLFAASMVSLGSVLAGVMVDTRVAVLPVERVHRLEAGKTATYTVALGSDVRKALLAGVDGGAFPFIFPAFVSRTPPVVDIDGASVRVADPIGPANWLLDTGDFVHAVRKMGPGLMTVRFTGGDDVWLGGWQIRGVPGRQFVIDGVVPASPVLPAVELRLLRDREPRRPDLVAF